MGFGDFKLLAALGAWLGWKMILPVVLAASVIGAVVGIAMKMCAALREGRYVPFGPFLAGAGLAVIFAGPDARARLAALGLTPRRPELALTTAASLRPDRRHRQRQEHRRRDAGEPWVLPSSTPTRSRVADRRRRCGDRCDPRDVRRRVHRCRRRPRSARMRAAAFDRRRKARRGSRRSSIPLIGVEAERQASAAAADAPAARLRHPAAGRIGQLARPRRCGLARRLRRGRAGRSRRRQRPAGASQRRARVIAQQAARRARRAGADAVIHNDGISLVELAEQVHRLWAYAVPAGA